MQNGKGELAHLSPSGYLEILEHTIYFYTFLPKIYFGTQRKNNKLLHKRQNHKKKIVNYSLPHQQVTIHYRTVTREVYRTCKWILIQSKHYKLQTRNINVLSKSLTKITMLYKFIRAFIIINFQLNAFLSPISSVNTSIMIQHL